MIDESKHFIIKIKLKSQHILQKQTMKSLQMEEEDSLITGDA